MTEVTTSTAAEITSNVFFNRTLVSLCSLQLDGA